VAEARAHAAETPSAAAAATNSLRETCDMTQPLPNEAWILASAPAECPNDYSPSRTREDSAVVDGMTVQRSKTAACVTAKPPFPLKAVKIRIRYCALTDDGKLILPPK